MSRDEEETETGTRNFGVTLAQIEDGDLLRDLGVECRKLQEVLAEHAANHGKAKGELMLRIAFQHDERGTVEVAAEVKTKTPVSKRGKSIFWVTPGGQLASSNPKQSKLPFRAVGSDTKNVKGVGLVIDGAVVKGA
jgi:hypothetical protein